MFEKAYQRLVELAERTAPARPPQLTFTELEAYLYECLHMWRPELGRYIDPRTAQLDDLARARALGHHLVVLGLARDFAEQPPSAEVEVAIERNDVAPLGAGRVTVRFHRVQLHAPGLCGTVRFLAAIDPAAPLGFHVTQLSVDGVDLTERYVEPRVRGRKDVIAALEEGLWSAYRPAPRAGVALAGTAPRGS